MVAMKSKAKAAKKPAAKSKPAKASPAKGGAKAKSKADAKTKPDAPKKPTKAEEHETLGEIVYAQSEVVRTKREFESAKQAAKTAKETFEGKQRALYDLLNDVSSGQGNLFSGAGAKPSANGKAKPGAKGDTPAPDVTDESWRTIRMSGLGLTSKIVSALSEGNIITLGDYSDYMQPRDNGFTNRLCDIKGIGKSAIDKIEAAVEQAFKEHGEKLAAQRAAASEVVEEVAESTAIADEPAKDAKAEPAANGPKLAEDTAATG